MPPLVTVVIPAYNAQATLAETIRSLLAQSLTDWRAVIIDDGSTDSTPMIASDFAWRDERITHVRQANRGLAAARNRGLDQADSRFVHFLDADDWLSPLGLERLVQAAEWSGRGAACGSWTLHAADGRHLGLTLSPPDQVVTIDHLAEGNAVAPHSHVLRRDLIGDLRFDDTLRVAEDYDLWLRLAARGVAWSSTDDVVAGYRIRPGSLSKNPRLMLETHAAVARRTLDDPHLSRGLRKAALFYATSAALSDASPGFAAARAVLRAELPNPAAFTPEELGRAAHWALVFSRGLPPARLAETAPAWLPRLRAWWVAIAGPDAADEALAALALEAVAPEDVANAMLDQVPPDSPAVLAGAMGRNGQVIRRAAARRARPLELRDDRLPRAGIERLINARATVLVAPAADAPVLAKLPRSIRTVRWSATREALSGGVLAALRERSDRSLAALGA